MMATASENENENFKCPICLEYYSEPMVVPCGNNHTFCADCINPQLNSIGAVCTLCRQPFNPSKVIKNKQIRNQMRMKQVQCSGCKEIVTLIQMRDHQADCSEIDRTVTKFHPIKETNQHIPRDLPNRHTFHCPYCDTSNLESRGLVEHCNKHHTHVSHPVVCPICASMPWGDRDQTSTNFIQHLNIRHKFEYDTYVDYQQDDDEMLRAAIQASLDNS